MTEAYDPDVLMWAEQVQAVRPNGVTSVRLTPEPVNVQDFRMGITSFEPGGTVAMHSHSAVEQVCVIEGEGTVVIDGEEYQVGSYDTTRIPPGVNHQFFNTGTGNMRILYVYGDINVKRTWAETGITELQFPPLSE